MSDEAFERIRDLCRRRSLPPGLLTGPGFGVPVHVVVGLAEPRIVDSPRAYIEVSQADYEDLRRRARALEWEPSCSAPHGKAG